ncbi:MAG: fused MFS/spermidine synthase [Nanoarchaeota archaeon]|nr:fused MFS/spermidine synthase [Nanoarchaeota archaeon]
MQFHKLILIAFMLSGLTALIYEVVWTRPLQLIFGSTIYAVSTMLTTFFVGFALGSYLFRNIADRTKNPALLFAALEFGIGLYGLIIIYLFGVLPSIYLSIANIPGFQFLQFTLIFLVLIIPTVLFGATWPVVNKAYVKLGELGKDVGLLYSFNSFGAFVGSIAAGFVLIPLLGIKATIIFAALLNILIAITIFAFSRKKGGEHGS